MKRGPAGEDGVDGTDGQDGDDGGKFYENLHVEHINYHHYYCC
jgi:hypothetical protein